MAQSRRYYSQYCTCTLTVIVSLVKCTLYSIHYYIYTVLYIHYCTLYTTICTCTVLYTLGPSTPGWSDSKLYSSLSDVRKYLLLSRCIGPLYKYIEIYIIYMYIGICSHVHVHYCKILHCEKVWKEIHVHLTRKRNML